MKNSIAYAVALMLLTSSPSFSAESAPQETPKLTLEQAQEIALKKVPGVVQNHELESEGGKSIYSFEVKTLGNSNVEVEVDANTGDVLEAEKDD